MPHKRSLAARQRRAAKRLIRNTARRDKDLAEFIYLLTPRDLMTMLQAQFNGDDNGIYEHAGNCERGEIIVDSRGRGSFQQKLPPVQKLRRYSGETDR